MKEMKGHNEDAMRWKDALWKNFFDVLTGRDRDRGRSRKSEPWKNSNRGRSSAMPVRLFLKHTSFPSSIARNARIKKCYGKNSPSILGFDNGKRHGPIYNPTAEERMELIDYLIEKIGFYDDFLGQRMDCIRALPIQLIEQKLRQHNIRFAGDNPSRCQAPDIRLS
jgi:hypothetical protein